MGRTNPTYRDFLEEYERAFGDYRRALRRQAQTDFDQLFTGARAFADAAGYANHLNRDTLVLVSMLLAHEGRIRELETTVETLESRIETLEAGTADDGARTGSRPEDTTSE
jgi:hypothetical protein